MKQAPNPLAGWSVDRKSIRSAGKDLQRPECILAERDGTLWSADARGGVMRIDASGTQQLIAQRADVRFTESNAADKFILGGTLPNGLAFTREGDFLIANFGTNAIEKMTREGESTTLYTAIDGVPLGKTNFVMRDSKDRVWITITTRMEPWIKCITSHDADGYVALIDDRGIRIVADGLAGTNEVRIDANEEWLYAVESVGRRISRFRIRPDSSLGPRETYGPEDVGGVPDGFAFDAFGNLWITLVQSDCLIALTPEGDILTLLQDGDVETARRLDVHSRARTTTPDMLLTATGTLAPMMASVTFGGPDLRTVYLGSLKGTTIPYFQSPVPGLPLAHWNQ